jgi:hypothetical protein
LELVPRHGTVQRDWYEQGFGTPNAIRDGFAVDVHGSVPPF